MSATKEELMALADRCEREEPSRELHFTLAHALGWTHVTSDLPSYWIDPDGYIWNLPDWLISLDDSVRPEGDDVFWRSGHDGEGPDPSLFRADVLLAGIPGANFTGRARTEAMARRAAELRARACLAVPNQEGKA